MKLNKAITKASKELNKKEIARKRSIIIDKFYPALIEATISVDESKALISAMANLLMEEVLRTMKDRKFDDIIDSLQKVLCQDGQRKNEISALLNTLKGENLYVAREIIEGMTRAIETMIIDEMRERNLKTLIPKWDVYLN